MDELNLQGNVKPTDKVTRWVGRSMLITHHSCQSSLGLLEATEPIGHLSCYRRIDKQNKEIREMNLVILPCISEAGNRTVQ